jgi:hypothetical protein
MLRTIIHSLAILLILNVVFTLSSCKDEDSGPPKLSFSDTEVSIPESGDYDVEIKLSGSAAEDIEIEYRISGTAVELSEAGIGEKADYEIEGDAGEIVIPKGERSATIQIHMIADGIFEDETIELSITNISDESIITSNEDDNVTISIEDDDEVVQASFAQASSSIVEDEGLIEVTVKIDKAADGPISVFYTLGGTAYDSLTAWEQGQIHETTYAYDYYVDGVSGEMEIAAGSTTGVIKIKVVSDVYFEESNILLTLQASQGVTVNSTADEHTVTLLQENGKAIWLQWDESYTTVDMDLFLWKKIGGEYHIVTASTYPDPSGDLGEIVFWPTAFGGGEFGLSHTYYEGDVDPMNFTVKFIDFIDATALLADSVTFPGRYTIANVNPWDLSGGIFPPPIAQTYTVTGGTYTINPIVPPTEGSRSRTYKYGEAIKPEKTKSTNKSNLLLR